MDFAFWGTVPPELAEFKDGLERALEQRYERAEDAGEARLIINFVDADDARPFRRQKKSTFVASFWHADEVPEDFVKRAYPVLVRALSNLSVCTVPGKEARFLTLEQGNYAVVNDGDDDAFYRQIVGRLAPL